MITFKFVDGYISPVLSTGDIIEVDGSYFEIAEPVNPNGSCKYCYFRDEHNECRLEYCPLAGAQVFLKTLKNNKQDERGEQAKSMAEEEGIYFY